LAERVTQNGTLLRTKEASNLRRQFDITRRSIRLCRFTRPYQAAIPAHYTSDARRCTPWSTTLASTGRTACISVGKITPFERYRDRFTIALKPVAPIANPRGFRLDTIPHTRLCPAS
jgi:hypothetical protein